MIIVACDLFVCIWFPAGTCSIGLPLPLVCFIVDLTGFLLPHSGGMTPHILLSFLGTHWSLVDEGRVLFWQITLNLVPWNNTNLLSYVLYVTRQTWVSLTKIKVLEKSCFGAKHPLFWKSTIITVFSYPRLQNLLQRMLLKTGKAIYSLSFHDVNWQIITLLLHVRNFSAKSISYISLQKTSLLDPNILYICNTYIYIHIHIYTYTFYAIDLITILKVVSLKF